MFDAVAAVSLLRHHVAHRPGFHRRQFFFSDVGEDGFVDLSFRASGQDQVGPFQVAEKVGKRGSRVITDRGPHFRIPKLIIGCGSPRTFHDAHETIFAFDRRFETMTSKNQDLGIP